MPRKDKKIVFRGVSATEVISTYYGEEGGAVRTPVLPKPIPTVTSKSNNVRYFADPHKNVSKYWVHMLDVHDYGALPLSTARPCWWCRSTFSSKPIGLPLTYRPDSDSTARREVLEKANLDAECTDFFVTEGMFCSFPCAKAYTLESPVEGGHPRGQSLSLLPLLYSKLMGTDPIDIPCAPNWKTLQAYGGHLSVSSFRRSFGNVEYVPTPNVRRPLMYTCSSMTREYVVKKNESTER